MIIDFRSPRWGLKIYASTWRRMPPRVERVGWLRKKVEHTRYSLMVHVPCVSVGDEIVYSGHGGDRTASVVEVKPCRDPRDMFTLTLENVRSANDAGLDNLCLEIALPTPPRFYQANPFEVQS